MARIRLSSSATVTPTGMGVVLRSDLGTFQLDGRDVQLFVNAMVPLLDGLNDGEAIAKKLEGYSRESVLAFLDLLEQHGLLETVPETPDSKLSERWRGQEAFFRKWANLPEGATTKLEKARVLVLGLEPWGVAAATELAASGIGALLILDDCTVTQDDLLSVRVWDNGHIGQPRSQALADVMSKAFPWCHITSGPLILGDDNSLVIEDTNWDLAIGSVTADDLLILQSLAILTHKAGIPSLYGYLEGLNVVIGPAVIPGQTACWNCCRIRQLGTVNHPEATLALQSSLLTKRTRARTHTYMAPMPPMAGHLLALEAVKLLTRYTPSFAVGRLFVQNLVSFDSSFHTIIRVPWCEVCGEEGHEHGESDEPDLGGDKNANNTKNPQLLNDLDNPEDLRQRLSGLLDDRTGIIKYLVRGMPEATEAELPITYSAILASHAGRTPDLEKPEIGSGKGLSSVEAMVGAVGEAIERYSAAWYQKRDLLRSSFNNMQEDALDPSRLCLYEEDQYSSHDFQFVRFHPEMVIDWTRGSWLDTGRPVWLPAVATYYNFKICPKEYFCQVTSNGLAAGANFEDAALRAALELVERDAFMVTWLAQLSGRKLILDDSVDAGTREVVRQLEERGTRIKLYLLDAGLSIPTVLCLGFGDGRNWPGVTAALAANMSPHIAIRKAILEQGHVGPYIRRLMLSGEHSIPMQPAEVHSLTDHALYYVPAHRAQYLEFLEDRSTEPVVASDLQEPDRTSLDAFLEKLKSVGVRVAVADVTSPDIFDSPFRVARALGENLQPIHFGFKFRRLASVRLKAMTANGLNPHPHPLA